MDTLARMFFSDIKVYDDPKEFEIALCEKHLPKRLATPPGHIDKELVAHGTVVKFRKPTWVNRITRDLLIFNGFHFTVLRER